MKLICSIVIAANLISAITNGISHNWQVAFDNVVILLSWILILILNNKLEDNTSK